MVGRIRTDVPPPLSVSEFSADARVVTVEHMAPFSVSVKNVSERTLTIVPRVDGIDNNWVIHSTTRLTLRAGEEQPLTVTLLPPRHPSTLAKSYPFALRLTCPQLPAWQFVREATLTVKPFYDLNLSLHPRPTRGGWFAPEGIYYAEVINDGNNDVSFVLEARAEGESCEVRFPTGTLSPEYAGIHAAHANVTLAPAERLTLPLTVAPRRRPLIGTHLYGCGFSVELTSHSNARAGEEARGEMLVPPLLDARWLSVAVLLLVAGGLAVALLLSNQNPATGVVANPAPEPVAISQPANEVGSGMTSAPSSNVVSPVGESTLLYERAPEVPVVVLTEVPVAIAEEEVEELAQVVAPAPLELIGAEAAPTRVPQAAAQPRSGDDEPGATTSQGVLGVQAVVEDDTGGERFEQLIQEVALHYGMDWHLLASMAYHESRLNPQALGRDNDMGLMQIVPGTWDLVAPQVNVFDPFDPYSNLMAGAYFLTAMQAHFTSLGYPQIYWALAAYNWGPTNVSNLLARGDGWGSLPLDVQWYVWNILSDASEPTDSWWQEELQAVVPHP